MDALALSKNNKNLLIACVALLIMLVAQVTVKAYDFGGGWLSSPLVGQSNVNSWQLVGDSLVDSDVNVAEMPTPVSTSIVNAVTGNPNRASFVGSVSAMGVATNATAFWQYGQNKGYGYTTPAVVISSPQSLNYNLTDFPSSWANQFPYTIHARLVVQVGSVYAYGNDVVHNFGGNNMGAGAALAAFFIAYLVFSAWKDHREAGNKPL